MGPSDRDFYGALPRLDDISELFKLFVILDSLWGSGVDVRHNLFVRHSIVTGNGDTVDNAECIQNI